MSCGACSEKTKAGASAASGAPVATGVAAQTRHCPQCGHFLPNSGPCVNCHDKHDGGTQAALKLAKAIPVPEPRCDNCGANEPCAKCAHANPKLCDLCNAPLYTPDKHCCHADLMAELTDLRARDPVEYSRVDALIELTQRVQQATSPKAIKETTGSVDDFIKRGIGWGDSIKVEGARQAIQHVYDFAMEKRISIFPPYDTAPLDDAIQEIETRVRRMIGKDNVALSEYPPCEERILKHLGNIRDYMRQPYRFGLYEETGNSTIRQELQWDFKLLKKWHKAEYCYVPRFLEEAERAALETVKRK